MLSMHDIYTAPWSQSGYTHMGSRPSLDSYSNSGYPKVQFDMGGSSQASHNYDRAQYARAGPSTPEKAWQARIRTPRTGWQTDSHGRVHYVELSVLEHFGQLSLEAVPRSQATSPLHPHLSSDVLEQSVHIFTDPLPEHTTPPPKPMPRILDLEDLPMPGGFPLSPSQYQDPWTVDCYQQTSLDSPATAQNALNNDQFSHLMFSPSPANGYALSSAPSPIREKSRIAQPQPKRVVRIDLLERFRKDPQSPNHHRHSLRQPDTEDAIHSISQRPSGLQRRYQEDPYRAQRLRQLDISERRAQNCNPHDNSSLRGSARIHDEKSYPSEARPDSGYESDAEETISLIPSASTGALARLPVMPSLDAKEDTALSPGIPISNSKFGCGYPELRIAQDHTSPLPPKKLDALTSQTLNLIDNSLKRFQHLRPSFDDLKGSLMAARTCLHRRRSLSHEEWNTRSEAWDEKYQERVLSMQRLVHGINDSLDPLYSHPSTKISTIDRGIWDRVSHFGKLLIGLASKLENSLDRLQTQYLDLQTQARVASKKAEKPMYGYLRY